jgi:hypothetical protein
MTDAEMRARIAELERREDHLLTCLSDTIMVYSLNDEPTLSRNDVIRHLRRVLAGVETED